jgi:hypothetical protein
LSHFEAVKARYPESREFRIRLDAEWIALLVITPTRLYAFNSKDYSPHYFMRSPQDHYGSLALTNDGSGSQRRPTAVPPMPSISMANVVSCTLNDAEVNLTIAADSHGPDGLSRVFGGVLPSEVSLRLRLDSSEDSTTDLGSAQTEATAMFDLLQRYVHTCAERRALASSPLLPPTRIGLAPVPAFDPFNERHASSFAPQLWTTPEGIALLHDIRCGDVMTPLVLRLHGQVDWDPLLAALQSRAVTPATLRLRHVALFLDSIVGLHGKQLVAFFAAVAKAQHCVVAVSVSATLSKLWLTTNSLRALREAVSSKNSTIVSCTVEPDAIARCGPGEQALIDKILWSTQRNAVRVAAPLSPTALRTD